MAKNKKKFVLTQNDEGKAEIVTMPSEAERALLFAWLESLSEGDMTNFLTLVANTELRHKFLATLKPSTMKPADKNYVDMLRLAVRAGQASLICKKETPSRAAAF